MVHGASSKTPATLSATRIVMLLTAVALLGFASSPGGGPDPVDAVCADTPDRTMIGITGGSTCSDLAGEGRCTSTDGLVAKVMEMNCKASCGGCGETRESRAYQVMGEEGDYSCKEYRDQDDPDFFYMMPMSKEAAEVKVCGGVVPWYGVCHGICHGRCST